MLDDGDIDDFVQQQIPANTKKKTKADVKLFGNWLSEAVPDESRNIWQIPPVQLNQFLRSFYLSVKKKNGEEYEPDSLKCIQNSLDRYLSDHHYTVSLLRGEDFKSSLEVLHAKCRALKSEGKGRKPNRAEHLTDEEEQVLWDKGIMGKGNPTSLQSAIWWRNNFFGIRGRDEHHKMRWGDITIESDIQGRRFVQYQERDTKTRKDPRDERPFAPRIYETPQTPDTCPVLLLLEYTHRRPMEMAQADSPFYIQPNPHYQKSGIWYKCQRLGVHSLSEIMKKMAQGAGLPGKKTNHSGRKTTIKRLREAEIDNVDIMQLTGHKNMQSLNSYSNVTEKKQRQMSDILVVQPSTSAATETTDDFSDDFDVDSVLQSIENFECEPVVDKSTPICMTSEANELNVTAQNSLGFTTPLFQSANISGGVINVTLNFNNKN